MKPPMKRKNLLLTLFLFVLPVGAITALLLSIVYWKDKRTDMDDLPRLGQGAGDTGGANYLGEKLAGNYDAPEAASPVIPAQHNDVSDEFQPVTPESLDQGFVIVVRDASNFASDERPIYLASNHVGWNPGAAPMKMQKRSDMRWQIVLPKPEDPSRLQFKFTLGSWETVELAANGEDNVPNRTLPDVDPAKYADGSRPVFEYEVPAFKQGRDLEELRRLDPYRTLDVTGTVKRLQVTGGAGLASAYTRDVLVWLPPGYDAPENASRQYPVLYMHDGQNLFEHLPGVYGEWHADETAQRLIESNEIEPIIIVGVPHGGAARIQEYVPFDTFRNNPAYGRQYANWFTSEVLPRVQRTFRVRTDPSGMAVGGSSLGAVISLYIAAENPGMFSGLLLESPSSLRSEDGTSPWRDYVRNVRVWPPRVFVGMGAKEAGDNPADTRLNEHYVTWAGELMELARTNGAADRKLLIGDNHAHNEAAWAERFPEALRLLFPVAPEVIDSDQGPMPGR